MPLDVGINSVLSFTTCLLINTSGYSSRSLIALDSSITWVDLVYILLDILVDFYERTLNSWKKEFWEEGARWGSVLSEVELSLVSTLEKRSLSFFFDSIVLALYTILHNYGYYLNKSLLTDSHPRTKNIQVFLVSSPQILANQWLYIDHCRLVSILIRCWSWTGLNLSLQNMVHFIFQPQ